MYSDEKITHATFKLPKTDVHADHPFRKVDNHEKLLAYLKQRLMLDSTNRTNRVAKYAQIDRDVAAWVKLSEDDKVRQEKHERDGTPQSTTISLPLTWVHIDDMMTYYAQTFAPNRGMFYHTAGPENSATAAQLVALMNSHAIYGSYYRHLLRAIFNILKFNVGGLTNAWATEFGPKLNVGANGETTVGSQKIFSGNKVAAVDMYNLFYDPSCELSQLHKDGEWFGIAEMKSHYWLKNKCLEGIYFNCMDILDSESPSDFTAEYYKDPPMEAKITDHYSGSGTSGSTNWYSYLTGSEGPMVNNAFELVHMYIRINPNDFGLIPGTKEQKEARNRYEIWRFTICNSTKIVQAQYMPNIHNYLPAFFGVMNDDFMRDAAKSPAEVLNPLQQFSSFLLNTHVKASMKNLFGTTFYDSSRIDYSKIPAGEVSARVPIKPQGYGQDIRTMVLHDNNLLDTKQTLDDLQGMMGLIDQFFPTQSLPSQIAGIDRAIDSQVAAVQQGSNRRQHKGARLLDDTLMRPLRFSLYYNIIQFQEDGADIADYFTGKSTKVDLSNLRDISIIDLIGQGLKAIDRQSVAGLMQQVIFAMIQAPQAAQGIDILSMLDYWTSMLDIDANMKQFAIPPAEQAVPPGGAAVGPDGNPINPATAPGQLTEPIYGA